MGSTLNAVSPTFLSAPTKPRGLEIRTIRCFSSYNPSSEASSARAQLPKTVSFRTLGAGKLGISRYPDFEYNADGGSGTGIVDSGSDGDISVWFDPKTLHIPPLTSATTKFLGLPLPPLLRIDIVPEVFQGIVNEVTGKVDLEFTAEFRFSIGSLYRAPPLLVKTVLTSEASRGKMKSGMGQRRDGEGKCKLVGVATVDPIDDIFMNSFLGLPTECLAHLNAVLTLSPS